MSSIHKRTMKLSEVIDSNLSLRISADKLFDEIDQLNEIEVILDFDNVQTISRSFAQQFLWRIEDSNKDIECINESDNIIKMLTIVRHPMKKPTIINKNEVINLSL